MGGSNGFGTVAVMKNARHLNGAKVYMTQGSRRLDVDTMWLAQFDSAAAKDVTTPEEFEKVRFYGEDVITEWRAPEWGICAKDSQIARSDIYGAHKEEARSILSVQEAKQPKQHDDPQWYP